jgi:hypothetical protein
MDQNWKVENRSTAVWSSVCTFLSFVVVSFHYNQNLIILCLKKNLLKNKTPLITDERVPLKRIKWTIFLSSVYRTILFSAVSSKGTRGVESGCLYSPVHLFKTNGSVGTNFRTRQKWSCRANVWTSMLRPKTIRSNLINVWWAAVSFQR